MSGGVPSGGDRLAEIEVVVSEFCPPGKAFIVNTDLLGIEPGGKLVAFHPDQRDLAERVEHILARDASVLKAHAAMLARLDSGAAGSCTHHVGCRAERHDEGCPADGGAAE